MKACKVEYAWGRYDADPMENGKKYFPTVEKALDFCNETLLHHKSWRIVQNGKIIQTLMGQIFGKPLRPHE